jgi:hypothetical protein
MWLQDRAGGSGSDGKVTYASGGRNLQFAFSCPVAGTNSASGPSNNFVARTGDDNWQHGSVPWLGRPLQVRFTVQ